MELTVENLKNCTFMNIAIFNNNHLVDFIFKDIEVEDNKFCFYNIIGSDNIFTEKEILKLFKDGKYYMYNADKILKP